MVNGYAYAIGGWSFGSQSTVYYAKLNADGTLASWQTSTHSLPVISESQSTVAVNGYIYVIGRDDGSTVKDTVYHTSTARILAGGNLDLVGLGGQSLGDVGGTGGSLTAGDGIFVGTLQVQGAANFADSVTVGQA